MAEDESDQGVTFKDVASVVTFTAGGLGTVLLAITNWGDDTSGLAAARRNHSTLIVIAAALAAAGMLLGAAYVIWRAAFGGVAANPPGEEGEPPPRRIVVAAIRVVETVDAALGAVLTAAVALVLAGVVTGVVATTLREPGLPKLTIERVSENALRVTVSGEGFPSHERFEIGVEGMTERGLGLFRRGKSGYRLWRLARWKFSPDQAGKLDASTDIALEFRANTVRALNSTKDASATGTVRRWAALRVILSKNKPRDCIDPQERVRFAPDVTCFVIVTPPLVPSEGGNSTPG